MVEIARAECTPQCVSIRPMQAIKYWEDISGLRAERILLQERKASLLQQLDEVETLLATNEARRAQLPHIYMLPDDVLRQIFEDVYEHHPPEDCASGCLPLVPSHVSHDWRRVALGLPKLWKCIHVGSHPPQLLELWLERSSNISLNLVIRDVNCSLSLEHTEHLLRWVQRLEACFDILRRHSPRWSFCTLWTVHERVFELYQHTVAGLEFPQLRRLIFLHTTSEAYAKDDFELPWSQPTSLTAHGLKPCLSMPSSSSLHELQTLELGFTPMSGRYLLDLSRAAPRLVSLTLQMLEGRIPGEERAVAVFPLLKILRFMHMWWEDVIDQINAPVLETLVWEGSTVWPEESLPLSLSIFPTVHTLQLRKTVQIHTRYDDVHFYRRIPSVTTLDLSLCEDMESILKALATAACFAADVVLPSLQVIRHSGGVDPPSLLAFQQDRMHSGKPLVLEFIRGGGLV